MNSLQLKIVPNDYYRDSESISTLINYANRLNNSLTTGINCSSDATTAINEFFYIRNFYQKNPARCIRHFIITSDSIKNEYKMLQLAYQIGLYYLNTYQVFIGVHNDTSNLHAHFIMNTVSFKDGLIYSASPNETNQFIHYITNLGFSVTKLNDTF